MIRFLDFLTPFVNELFKARYSQHSQYPQKPYKRVIAYAIIASSLLANYFLVKKVYSLTYTAYTYNEKYKEMQNFPLLLGACEEKNSVLVAIIDNALDPLRPISRPADTQIDTMAMNHSRPKISADKPVKNSDKIDKPNPVPQTKSKKNLDHKSDVGQTTTVGNPSSSPYETSVIEQRRERMLEAQKKFRDSMDDAAKSRQDSLNN